MLCISNVRAATANDFSDTILCTDFHTQIDRTCCSPVLLAEAALIHYTQPTRTWAQNNTCHKSCTSRKFSSGPRGLQVLLRPGIHFEAQQPEHNTLPVMHSASQPQLGWQKQIGLQSYAPPLGMTAAVANYLMRKLQHHKLHTSWSVSTPKTSISLLTELQ